MAGWLAAVVSAISAVTLRMIDPAPVLPNAFGFGDAALVGFGVMGVAFASVGALLVIRRPRNSVGWCMVVIGAAEAGSSLGAAVTFSAVAQGTQSSLQLAAVTAWSTVAFQAMGSLIFVLPFIFPTGRGHTRLWDRQVRLALIVWPLPLLLLIFQPGPLHTYNTISNPFGFGPDLRTIVGFSFSQAIMAGATFFAPFVVIAFVSRYRSADHVERQQLKWFLLSSLVSIVGVSLAAAGAVLSNEAPGEAGLAIFGFAGALIPVAIGIAILRHRLYNIDRVISRTLGYAVVTGLLGAVFAVLILSVQTFLTAFTQGQTIAVAFSTLVVFGLFQPVRRRVQRAVDRRFDRGRYDADRMVESLAGRLRAELDLTAVGYEIARTADAAMRPTRVAVWLRPATDASHPTTP